MCNILHDALLVNVDVHPVRLEIHGLHGVGLENAVFLGEIGGGEGLVKRSLLALTHFIWGAEQKK